jgi:hypothetical protein
MKEEEPPFEPMPIEEAKELYARVTEPGCEELSLAMPNQKTKRLIETLFWLTNEHAQAMNDLQNMKWMKIALMAIIHKWGRSGKLEIDTKDCKENWTLGMGVDLKGIIRLQIGGYPKSNLILPGGMRQ